MTQLPASSWRWAALALLLLFGPKGQASADEPALTLPWSEGAVHGFPEMLDDHGQRLAEAEFTQVPEGDRVRVKLSYDFGNGHTVEENTVVQQRPALVQSDWSWEEIQAGSVVRRYHVDFSKGIAEAEKLTHGERKTWRKEIRIEPRRTFAGFAFTLALEGLKAEPGHGANSELRAVAFTPQPRVVTVEVVYAGADELAMAGRRIAGDKFVLHPKVPAIARPFVTAPDTYIWLIHGEPSGFLRWQGPLAEPSDAIVRVDLLPTAAAATAPTP